MFGGYLPANGKHDSNMKMLSSLFKLLHVSEWLDMLSDSPIHCYDDGEEDNESPLTAMKSMKHSGLFGSPVPSSC